MTTALFMVSAVAMGTCLVGFPPKSLRRDKGLYGTNTWDQGVQSYWRRLGREGHEILAKGSGLSLKNGWWLNGAGCWCSPRSSS